MRNSIRTLTAVALVATLGFATGCSDDDDNTVAPTPTGRIMAVHASPDAPAVNLLVDNTVVGTGLTYPNNTAYLSVNAGTRNIKVNPTANPTVSVIDADVNVAAGASYTVWAVNFLAAIEPVVTTDDLTTPATGKAHVRFVHLSPNAPAVDVALDGGSVVFGDYTFKEASAFTPLNAGTYDLEVRLAGTSTVALDLDPITLQAGKIYTVFAKGSAAASPPVGQELGAGIIVNN
jgi:hypothetical protein